jgi:hypothetical protein
MFSLAKLHHDNNKHKAQPKLHHQQGIITSKDIIQVIIQTEKG